MTTDSATPAREAPVQVGVGRSRNRSPQQAAAEAARQARATLDGDADVVIAFATCGYDQPQLVSALCDALPGVPLVGCSAEGVICRGESDEGSHALALMALRSSRVRFQTFSVQGLSQGSAERGAELGRRIAEAAQADARVVLLFPDGLTANYSELLTALTAELPKGLQVAGGTSGDMMRFERTFQYCSSDVMSDGASALLISGELDVEIFVSHGCDVIGLERAVTRAEGSSIYEIDGRPAWDVFRVYLYGYPETLRDAGDTAHLAIAERLDEPCAYGTHIVRVPLRHEVETGALLFGAEVTEGTRISMTRRVPGRVVEHAVASASRVREARDGLAPAFVLQLDCAGRGRLLFGSQAAEMGIEPLRDVLGHDTPWLGCYTFGEIAAPAERVRFHNYTVVVCAFYERAGEQPSAAEASSA